MIKVEVMGIFFLIKASRGIAGTRLPKSSAVHQKQARPQNDVGKDYLIYHDVSLAVCQDGRIKSTLLPQYIISKSKNINIM